MLRMIVNSLIQSCIVYWFLRSYTVRSISVHWVSSTGTELVQSWITFIHNWNAPVSRMFTFIMKRLNTGINYVILFEMILHLRQKWSISILSWMEQSHLTMLNSAESGWRWFLCLGSRGDFVFIYHLFYCYCNHRCEFSLIFYQLYLYSVWVAFFIFFCFSSSVFEWFHKALVILVWLRKIQCTILKVENYSVYIYIAIAFSI